MILFKPLFFNAFNSPLSNNLINRNCEDNKILMESSFVEQVTMEHLTMLLNKLGKNIQHQYLKKFYSSSKPIIKPNTIKINIILSVIKINSLIKQV